MAKALKLRNPQDATLRNVRAAKARDTRFANRILLLETRVATILLLIDGLSNRLVTLEGKKGKKKP